MLTEEQIERLKEIGTEWQKGSYHRIYFDDITARLGLDITFYKSGNVMSAELDGERISNSECRRILDRAAGAKFFYDMIGQKFHSQYGHLHTEERDRVFASIKEEAGIVE